MARSLEEIINKGLIIFHLQIYIDATTFAPHY